MNRLKSDPIEDWPLNSMFNPTIPKSGDTFLREKCGVKIQVAQDCNCNDAEHVHLQCCG
jgi:hypothetical protein